ncbi:MAG: phosphoribosyltransferase [Euryarchaeota archaeon]|nr:phosphoribosyltransferase [Euryarchaeota archaeon]
MVKKEYVLVTWDHVYRLALGVARQVKKSDYRPDAVIGIARGGWFHARVLCDVLLLKNLYNLKVEHWGLTASITGEAKVVHPLDASLTGMRVLVVDDIADTGESLRLAQRHARERGAQEVRTATLQYITTSTHRPDYFEETLEQWKWVIFPWNFHEDMSNVIAKLLAEKGPQTREDLERHLRADIGLNLGHRFDEVMENMEYHRKARRQGERWAAA